MIAWKTRIVISSLSRVSITMQRLRLHLIALVAFHVVAFSIPLHAQKVFVETALNLRSTPSKSGDRLDLLKRGEVVDLIGPDSLQNGFFHVRTSDNRDGWIAIPFAHIIRPRSAVLDSVTFVRPTAPLVVAAARCEQCGGAERWNVKTLSDRDANEVESDPVSITIKELRAFDPPDHKPQDARAGEVERTTYVVEGLLVGWVQETEDDDFHLVIADEHNRALTIIAEIPTQSCRRVCRNRSLSHMGELQQKLVGYLGDPPVGIYKVFTRAIPVTITGVGFFDKLHGQCGRSKHDGIELHLVIDISFDESVPVPQSVYTPGQKYNDLIAEIKKSPAWCKVLLSAFHRRHE